MTSENQFDNFMPQLEHKKFSLSGTVRKLKQKLALRQELNATCVDDSVYNNLHEKQQDLNQVSQEIEAYSALGIPEQSCSIKDYLQSAPQ